MKTRWKCFSLFFLHWFSFVCLAAEITSFDRNGVLIFSAASTDVNYRVEWASTLTNEWQHTWENLSSIRPEQLGAVTSSVPMFFRVVEAPSIVSKNPRVVLFGDSLTAQNTPCIEDVYWPKFYGDSIGYFNWARGFCHSPLEMVANRGVGGETTAQMLSRIDEVIADMPDVVILCGGRNDVSQERMSSSQSISNLTEIVNRLAAEDIQVVLMNVTPQTAVESTERILHRREINQWIAQAEQQFDNVAIVDAESAIVNFATTAMRPYMAFDGGTHWSQVAAARIGKKVGDVLNKVVPAMPYEWGDEGDSELVCANPFFTNQGDGWTAYGGTVHYLPSYKHQGNQAVITVTNASSCYLFSIENKSEGRFSAGDKIQLQADIEWEIDEVPDGNQSFVPYGRIRARNSNNTWDAEYYLLASASSQHVPISDAPRHGRGIWQTPEYTVGSNVDRLYFYVGMQGIKKGQLVIHQLSVFRSED